MNIIKFIFQIIKMLKRYFSDTKILIRNFLSPEKELKIAKYTLIKDKKFLDNIYEYENYLDPENIIEKSIYENKELIQGFATDFGTNKFRERTKNIIPQTHFRFPYNSQLKLSSIGIGTCMGDINDTTDFSMYNAIKESILCGAINLIDTCIFLH